MATVLVIEHDDVTRISMAAALTDAGMHVIVAASAADGIDKLGHRHVDAIVSDVVAGDSDSSEGSIEDGSGCMWRFSIRGRDRCSASRLLTYLEVHGLSIPVILTTCGCHFECMSDWGDGGAYDHIAKPINLDRLESALHQAFG